MSYAIQVLKQVSSTTPKKKTTTPKTDEMRRQLLKHVLISDDVSDIMENLEAGLIHGAIHALAQAGCMGIKRAESIILSLNTYLNGLGYIL